MTPKRDSPEWTIGEEGNLLREAESLKRHTLRQEKESWRLRGLKTGQVCRCEQATPCFEHMVYLADLRTAAEAKMETPSLAATEEASRMFSDATEFYLKLVS